MGEESKMNGSVENQQNKTISGKGSLENKIRNYMLIFSATSMALIGIILFFTFRKVNLNESYKRLDAVNLSTKNQLEEKLDLLKDHARVLSANQTMVQAMDNFRYQFRMVNGDSSLMMPENEFDNVVVNLRSYYAAHVVPNLNERLIANYTADDFFPDERRTKLLQHLYISSNPNPPGEKHLLDKGLDFSRYSNTHYQYHPFIRHLAQNYDFKDVILADNESGYIVYSYAKKIDFGTSLISGPYRETLQAETFKRASDANSRDVVILSDIEYYPPNGGYPVFYVASPVFDGVRKLGVLMIALSTDEIEEVVSVNNNTNAAFGETGENLLIGRDLRVRNNMLGFTRDPENFAKTLQKMEIDKETIQKIKATQTTSLFYQVQYDAALKVFQGEKGSEKVNTNGTSKLLVYRPIETTDVDWSLLTVQEHSEIISGARNMLIILIVSFIVFLVLVYFLSGRLAGTITWRLEKIRKGITLLSKGESFEEIKDRNMSDELGDTMLALNTLNDRINGASEFARKLGKEDFEATYDPVSENDQLGISLNEMKTSLVEAKKEQETRSEEDQKRNWSTQGIAKFSDILRMNSDNIEDLSYTVVSNLVEYMNANQAGIFVVNDEEENEKTLELAAAYAFDRRKYISRTVHFGEGMVGACALEKKTMYLKDVPENYINITSGLGEANPKSLLIVPMIVEDNVLGVIEIASFNEFEQHEIEFAEKIAENIGSTLVTVKVNTRTAKLLEESKSKAEEMASQEEEMRQNMEELQATQEEMKRIKEQEAQKEKERRESEEKIMQKLREQNDELKMNQEVLNKQKEELSKEKYLMDALMESIPEHIYFKDKESRFIRFSKSMLKLFGLKSNEELLGKSDFDFFSEQHARPAFEDEQEIIKTGNPIIDKIEKETFDDGKTSWVNTSKLPLRDHDGQIIGTFGISKDITHIKQLELEAKAKADRIEQLENEIKELQKLGNTGDKDKKIKKLEKELDHKNKEIEKIMEEIGRTKGQIDALRKKKKK